MQPDRCPPSTAGRPLCALGRGQDDSHQPFASALLLVGARGIAPKETTPTFPARGWWMQEDRPIGLPGASGLTRAERALMASGPDPETRRAPRLHPQKRTGLAREMFHVCSPGPWVAGGAGLPGTTLGAGEGGVPWPGTDGGGSPAYGEPHEGRRSESSPGTRQAGRQQVGRPLHRLPGWRGRGGGSPPP